MSGRSIHAATSGCARVAGPFILFHRMSVDSETSTVAVIRDALRRAAGVVRRVIGAPDYERYVAHVRACHPGTTPMSQMEFERARLEQRYSQPGQRCC